YFLIQFAIRSGIGKIVECLFRYLNDMTVNEVNALSRTLYRIFNTTFPFNDCPPVEPIPGELCKDTLEIYLSISQRTEPSGPVNPVLIASINAGLSIFQKFGVLNVKRFYTLVIEVDKLQIIQLLKYEMTWVV